MQDHGEQLKLHRQASVSKAQFEDHFSRHSDSVQKITQDISKMFDEHGKKFNDLKEIMVW